MAQVAGIWNLQRIRIPRRDEVKGVASNILVSDRLFDFRHVTGDALATRTAGFMMGMPFDGGRVRPGLRVWAVTAKA